MFRKWLWRHHHRRIRRHPASVVSAGCPTSSLLGVLEVMSFLPATDSTASVFWSSVQCVLVMGNWAPDVQCCPEPLATRAHWLLIVWFLGLLVTVTRFAQLTKLSSGITCRRASPVSYCAVEAALGWERRKTADPTQPAAGPPCGTESDLLGGH